MEQRIFAVQRAVRGTDVNTDGRLRLDALARYLQDAAEDDVTDAGLREPYIWVLRRCALDIGDFPRLGQMLTVRTFCSGIGPRWAERTTTLTTMAGGDDELVRATAVWAAVSADSGRPFPLGAEFHRVYGPSAGGRTVTARLSHPKPPDGHGPDHYGPNHDEPDHHAADHQEPDHYEPDHYDTVPWPLRTTDFDASGHVNNTIHWSAVEDTLTGTGWLPGSAEIEYHRAALPGVQPRLLVAPAPGLVQAWLLDGSDTRRPLASARLSRG
jgi:acyl-ACP thioesterase